MAETNARANKTGAVKDGGGALIEGKLDRFLITKEYYELKTRIHDRLLTLIDLSLLDSLEENVLRQEIRKLVERILAEEKNSIPLNFNERERLFKEIQYEVMGLGPLEPFMQDPTVSDILVNTHKQIYVERFGNSLRPDSRTTTTCVESSIRSSPLWDGGLMNPVQWWMQGFWMDPESTPLSLLSPSTDLSCRSGVFPWNPWNWMISSG
jgi:hypothetical protein